MNRAAFVVLAAALAACGRSPAPTAQPTPEAIGAEIATFSQILVPLSTQTISNLKIAAELKGGLQNVTTGDFTPDYQFGSVTADGKPAAVLVAFSDPWLAPTEALTMPMSLPQFLRAYEASPKASLAVLIAPRGEIIITREHLPRVRQVVAVSGRPDADLPFVLIRGHRR